MRQQRFSSTKGVLRLRTSPQADSRWAQDDKGKKLIQRWAQDDKGKKLIQHCVLG